MASTTVRSFNHILEEFVDELSETFNDYPQIMLFKAGLPGMLEKDPWYGVNTMMETLAPHGEKIMNNDRTFFEEDLHLGMGLKLNQLWQEDLDDDTRDAIANYVSTLFMLGMTLKSIDPNLMQQIEGIAQTAAMGMKQQGKMDVASMLPGMIQQVGGLLGAQSQDIDAAMGGEMQQMMQGMMQQVSQVMGGDALMQGMTQPSIEDVDDDEDMDTDMDTDE
jgi:hypothetical protein